MQRSIKAKQKEKKCRKMLGLLPFFSFLFSFGIKLLEKETNNLGPSSLALFSLSWQKYRRNAKSGSVYILLRFKSSLIMGRTF